jgi:RNA polymerase sigma-70 factor (ECF subfamily)
MRLNPQQLEESLAAARAGSREALGRVLSQYHSYLLQVARRQLARDLQPKGGASDLVQETFLEAQRFFDRFEGHSGDELRAWLRCVLVHQTAKAGRRFRATQKRRLAREVRLDTSHPPAAIHAALPAAPVATPSALLLARERQEVLLRALDRLPEDYRRVMALRYQQEMTFEEIGRDMRRSADAARMLWARALERLKHELRSFVESA